MRQFHLKLFGTARVLNAAGEAVALPKPAFSLALRLLLANAEAGISRIEAACFLWPDAPDAAANLRQLLRRIKASQGEPGLFQFGESTVGLNLGAVDCDVVEFQKLLRVSSFADAQRLLELFGTGLSVTSSLAEGAGEWMRIQGERFREMLVAALCTFLERADAASAATQTVADQLLQVDPHEERAWRALMRSFAACGQMRQFEAAYRTCCDTLRRDLNILPEPATTELFHRHRPAPQPVPRDLPDPLPAQWEKPAERNMMPSGGVPRLLVLPPASVEAGAALTLATLLLDDIVVGLCFLKSVSVVASHSSWKLHRCFGEDQAIVERLQVGYLVETALFRLGSESRLTLKLFDSATRSIRWAESFTFSETHAEQCHRRTVSGIVSALADAVEQAEMDRHETSRSPTAYYCHLLGQKHLRALELPAVRRASKAFRRSVAIDPGFAPAHSGQARTLQREWLLLGRGDDDLLDLAEASGRRAAEIDPSDGRGFRELGIVNLYKRRFDEALGCYQQAERLMPQHADTIADFADALAHSGKPDAGLRKMERAFELNPFPPDQYRWDHAGMLFQLGRFHEAIEAVDKMSNPTAALRVAAASWAMIGNAKKAAECRRRFLETHPDFRIEDWLVHVPNRNAEFTAQYVQGLRAAGFN